MTGLPQAEVFVSWTRADDGAGWVRPLVGALRAAGVRVWFDEEEIGPFDSIPDRVRAGLAGSKVMVACYSAAYPSRRACREELTLALLTGGDAERVLVVNPEPDAGHIVETPLSQRRWAGPGDLADLPALAGRIAARAAAASGVFGELPGTGPARWYGGEGWHGGSRRFVGRLDLLWRIHDRLTRTGQLAGGRPGRGVVIASGFGGAGKSLLAVEYAHLFASCYPGGVVWLSALGNDTTGRALPARQADAAVDEQWSNLALELGLDPAGNDPAGVRVLVKNRLAQAGRVLWIVDDLPTGLSEKQLAAWRCVLPNVAELMTTRDRAHTRLDLIDVDVLDAADAWALLTQQRSLPPEEAEQARLLAQELGFHPLGCDVAGRYVAGGSSFAAYRQLIAGRLQRADVLAEAVADQLPGDHARSIAATLATSLAGIGREAWLLLEVVGQLGPLAVPRRLPVDVFDRLPWKQQGDTSGDPLPGEVRAAQALQDRHGDGLWRYDADNEAVTVHVLVRAAAQAVSPLRPARPAIRRAVVGALTEALREGEDAHQRQRLRLTAEHARWFVIDPDGQDLGGRLNLFLSLAEFEHAGGRYRHAAELWQRIYDHRRAELGDEHADTLISANNLAAGLRGAGDLTGAVELNRQVYDVRRRILGDDHPDTLFSASNLAFARYEAGDLSSAAELTRRTYEARRRVLGDDHPDTLTSASNLAVVRHAAGDLAGAAELMSQTYEARRRTLGDEHPDVLASAGSLAAVRHAAGDLTGAVELMSQTYEARRRTLGDEHPDVLTSAGSLAAARHAAGDLRGAAELARRTYDTSRRVLGDDHPGTLVSASNLAACLHGTDDRSAAADLARRTYETARRVLGDEHPDTLAKAHVLGSLLHDVGDLTGAIALLRHTGDARRRVLGDDHPDTLNSANGLGCVLREAGDRSGATALLQRTYDARRRVLGDEHRDTLDTASNLAVCLRETGNPTRSAELAQRTYDARRRLLGEGHTDTLNSANILVLARHAAGDPAGAAEPMRRTYETLRELLGDNHPDTLIAAKVLALVLRAAGDPAAASAIGEEPA